MNIGHTTLTIPVRMKGKYERLKESYTTQKLGCKIPLGVITVQALDYVTKKMADGKVSIEFNQGSVVFKEIEKEGDKEANKETLKANKETLRSKKSTKRASKS